MASIKLPNDMIEKSQARLTELCQRRFEQRLALRKEGSSGREITLQLLHNLAKEDHSIEQEMKNARQRSLSLAKSPLPKPLTRKFAALEDSNSTDVAFSSPFPLTWTWNAETGGTSFYFDSSDATGNMVFNISAQDSGTASAAVAVGGSFQPVPGVGIMNVSAIPSIAYSYGNQGFLRHTHTHAWIGLYISELTLGGDYVQDVVDQQINLWDLTSDDGFSGDSSGYPLSASIPVDNDHIYQVWVWAGGDTESGGHSWANLRVIVPWISIHLY